MGALDGIGSQVANIRRFASLFRPASVLRNAVTLPFDLASPSGRADRPMALNVVATSRCNLSCRICWAADARRRRPGEMSPDDLERVAARVAAWRPSVFLTGGEPFVRADALELFAVVKRHGLPAGVVTNGVLVDPERGARLKAMGLDAIVFSVHGAEDVHDRVTGAPGAFRRTMENVAAFCRGPRPTRVLLNVVLSADNVSSLDAVAAAGRDAGVDHVRVEHLLFMTEAEVAVHAEWCRGALPDVRGLEASTFHCGREVPPGMPPDLPRRLADLRRRWRGFVSVKPMLDADEVAGWYSEGHVARRTCLFVWRSLFLDPEGYVIPCQHYPSYRLGNALREPLLEIWNSPRYRLLRRAVRRSLLPGCARCTKL